VADIQQSVVEFWRRWLLASLECPTCKSSREYRLLAGFDWRDLDALNHVRDQHPLIACVVCGAPVESPFPLVQHRPTDMVRVLVILPVAAAPRIDGLSEMLASLSNDEDVIVGPLSTVPAALGHRLLVMHTGLLLSSIEKVSVDDDEMRSWLTALKAEAELPDVVRALAAFVSENDQAAAAESLHDNLEVLDDRWRPVRRRLAEHWRSQVADDGELRVLNARLRRLDQWVLFDGAPPDDQSSLPITVTDAVDAAIAVDPHDDSGLRLDRLLTALAEVRLSASPTLLIGTLNSTVAALLSMRARSTADLAHAVELANELVVVASAHLGPRHRLTRRARNDRLVALIDRDVLAPAVVESLVELAQECVDEKDTLLSDVLLNLAVALGEATVVMSADEQMLSIRLFRLCNHLLALHEPDDLATRVRVLNNMAAALRRSPLGRTQSNRNEAVEAYNDAVRLDDSAQVLATAGRFQLDANLLNVWVESTLEQDLTNDVVASMTDALDEFAERTRETFDPDHPTRWRTMLNLSTLAVEAYDSTFRAESAQIDLLERGRAWAHEGQIRCAMAAVRWTLLNAEGVACARPVPPGGVLDESRAREAFQAVLDETSLPDDAAIRRVVAHNLGQVCLGAGDWDNARIAYGEAAAAADVVIRGATSLNGRIADIENASDITLLHALCCLHVDRVSEAIAAIEGGRQRLTAEDSEDDDLDPLFTADQAVVWVMTSTLGSALIATSQATVGVVHIHSLNSRQLMPLIHELQTARSFDDANAAISRINDALIPLLAPITQFWKRAQRERSTLSQRVHSHMCRYMHWPLELTRCCSNDRFASFRLHGQQRGCGSALRASGTPLSWRIRMALWRPQPQRWPWSRRLTKPPHNRHATSRCNDGWPKRFQRPAISTSPVTRPSG
jgi:tetratricopeptide (TPR) repeat protein